MERGVVIGGLMICGSFLLAALLNRSAMEEMPTRPTPAAVVAPITSPEVEADVVPASVECSKAELAASSVTKTEQIAADRCGKVD